MADHDLGEGLIVATHNSRGTEGAGIQIVRSDGGYIQLTNKQWAALVVWSMRRVGIQTASPASSVAERVVAEVSRLVEKLVLEEREACAAVARDAPLPDSFAWGREAMEQYDFGRERAAEAIRARGKEKTNG